MNIYEIQNSYNQAIEIEDDTERTKALELIQEQGNNKINNIAKFNNNLSSNIEAIDNEIERLSNLKQQITKKQDWLRNYVKGYMETNGINKIETELFKLSIVNNPESLNIIDETKIPEIYKIKEIKEIVKVDKNKIKEDIKKGLVPFVEGTELTRSTRLSIK